ncbi:MAG: trypsin-like serine protease [Clostridiales bacterium]|nr:trypsin-like serine protease [Clostridiales bacterium]
MSYNNSGDNKWNYTSSEQSNGNSRENQTEGTDYGNVSYSPNSGYYSRQSYDNENSGRTKRKKRSQVGFVVFAILLCFVLAVVLIGVGIVGIVNSEIGQLMSSNIRIWADNRNEPFHSETPSVKIEDKQEVEKEEKADAFVPIENPPTIDIVSVKDREIEKIYDNSGREVLEIPEIVDRVSPSVVGITNTQIVNNMTNVGIGSGIIFSADGYILTNQHVVNNSSQLTVYLEDGSEYEAILIGEDAKADLAIIKIDGNGLKPAEFGDSDNLRIGELAVAIGSPASLDLQGTTTSGIISALNREIMLDSSGRTLELIQTDAAINPGNSGGPLINKFGQVIGINTVKLSASSFEGICFAIPSNVIKPIIDDLMTYGHVKGYPTIGITGQSLGSYEAKVYKVPVGVLISSVDKKSNAHSAGLKMYDIITLATKKKLGQLRISTS